MLHSESKGNHLMSLFPRELLTDHVGACRTQSLYKETNTSNLEPIMVLGEADRVDKKTGKLLPSLRRLYMEYSDPHEYEVAMGVFGSWHFWKRQCNNAIIAKHIEEWREELEIKLRSEAFRSIHDTAIEGGTRGIVAAKFLADKGWVEKKGAGRPSKEEVARELKIQTAIKDEFKSDAERLGLTSH